VSSPGEKGKVISRCRAGADFVGEQITDFIRSSAQKKRDVERREALWVSGKYITRCKFYYLTSKEVERKDRRKNPVGRWAQALTKNVNMSSSGGA